MYTGDVQQLTLNCFKQEPPALTLPEVLTRNDPGWMKLKGMDTCSWRSREICRVVELTAGWKGTTWGSRRRWGKEKHLKHHQPPQHTQCHNVIAMLCNVGELIVSN